MIHPSENLSHFTDAFNTLAEQPSNATSHSVKLIFLSRYTTPMAITAGQPNTVWSKKFSRWPRRKRDKLEASEHAVGEGDKWPMRTLVASE